MLNFVPKFQPLVPAAPATMNTTLQLWTTFDTWTETVKLDRIDIIIVMLSFLILSGVFHDYDRMLTRREMVDAVAKAAAARPLWVGLSESNTPPSPVLVSSPPPEMIAKSQQSAQSASAQSASAQSASAQPRACVSPPDELTQALLSVLSEEYSLTTQQLREALPEAWATVEKSEVNTRLYKMLKKNMVMRWQVGSEAPMWSPPM